MLKITKILFMIPVTLSKKGHGRWITQHFGANGHKMQPMIIPRCARCFGIFIFWKARVGGKIIYSITGLHLPPGTPRYTKYTGKEVLRRLMKELPLSQPYYLIACGGNINTPQNRFFYKKSWQHYLSPFKIVYPDLQVNMYAVEKNTVQTTMYLHENGTTSAKLYHPIT